MLFTYLLQGLGLGFAAGVQPGPFQTYLITRTLENGWRRTLVLVLAPLLSDGPIVALVFLVLSRLPGWLERLLYTLGGLFIIYLAWQSLRAWQRFDASASPETSGARQSIWRAVLVNLLNPNPYIFWSLVNGPILVASWRLSPAYGIGFLLVFYGAMFLCQAGVILLFGTAQRFGGRVRKALLGLSALALAGFGLFQLWLGLFG